jgi:NMT1-like family
MFAQGPKAGPVFVPIESAGAIAELQKAYESFDVPKGTFRGSPAIPDDDLTTLRVSFYVVAHKKLDNDVASTLTQALLNARRDLIGELPILSQVTAPDTDPDAFLPVHPGAAAFYNGTTESFMDRWSNTIYLTPMVLGGLASVLAFCWKFLGIGNPLGEEAPLDRLYALARRIRQTDNEAELATIEDEIDDILRAQRAKARSGDDDAMDVTTLNVTAHRLENLVHDRRAILASLAASRAP